MPTRIYSLKSNAIVLLVAAALPVCPLALAQSVAADLLVFVVADPSKKRWRLRNSVSALLASVDLPPTVDLLVFVVADPSKRRWRLRNNVSARFLASALPTVASLPSLAFVVVNFLFVLFVFSFNPDSTKMGI